ncbi:MAG TPA: 30S ribosomal protein S1 [Proteiniclasticum sp.]|nr:30S ribosomal protein S1 [Proteiniclasticum sp.]
MDEKNMNDISMEEAMEGFALNKVKDGDILEGTILKVNKDEVIVNINYYADGVIPREELTKDHHEDITETNQIGDKIKVVVLKADDGEGNVLLSKIKADAIVAKEDLEKAIEDKKTVEVKVIEVVKGGLRVFFNGLSGFMPASLVSNTYVEDLSKFVGETLETYVEEYDEEQNRLIFSRKALLVEKGAEEKVRLLSTLKEGQTVEGTVSNITSYGAFIDLGGLIGLAHISDLAYGRINHPSEVLSVGEKVSVHILKIDQKKEKVSLSLKNKGQDPWNRVHEMKIGSVHEATIKKIIDAGAIVQLENGIDGLVHISEISYDHVTDVNEILKEGQKVNVKLLNIDDERKRVSFSIKDAEGEDQSFYDQEEDSVTLGDVFQNLMDKFKEEE